MSRVLSYGLLLLILAPALFAYLSIHLPLAGVLYDPSAQGLRFARIILDVHGRPTAAWSIPAQGAAAGTSDVGIVCVHGHGGSRADALYLFGFLALRGYELVIPALRGHQDGPPGPITFGDAESAEVEAAIAHLRARGKRRIVGMGVSMGASTLILHDARSPGTYEALVLDAPFARLSDMVRWRLRATGPLAPLLGAFTRPWGRFFSGHDLWQIAPEDEIARGRCPVLLLHGDEDTNIPPDQSRRLAAAAPGRVTFVSVPGAEHLRCRAVDPEGYEQRIVDFLARHKL